MPTPTVSVVDFACTTEKSTTTEELRAALKAAADGELKGILGYATEPLVSMDYKGDPRSGIVVGGIHRGPKREHGKVVAWYDNEWGYSCRGPTW